MIPSTNRESIKTSVALQKSLGINVNLKAALCTTCTGLHVNVAFDMHAKFPWATNMYCVNCSTSWTICRLCPNHRSKITKQFMLNRHNRLYHVHNSTTELSPEVESNGQPSIANESSQAVDYPDGCSISAANQEFHLYSNQPHHMEVEPAVPVVDDSLESEQHFVEAVWKVNSSPRTQLQTSSVMVTPIVLLSFHMTRWREGTAVHTW